MPASMSGVVVGDDVTKAFKDLIDHKKSQFVVCRLDTVKGKSTWSIVEEGTRLKKEEVCLKYNEFVEKHLNTEQAVFAIYDFSDLGYAKLNVVGLQWCPDTCNVSVKMTFASSVDPLKKLCEGCSKIFAKNERDEVELTTILKNYPSVPKDLLDGLSQ